MSVDGSKIRLIALDVDGTLTDGGIYILDSGEQFKKFNSKDGLGIQLAVQQGMPVGIISHSKSDRMIRKRAEMMGITRCYVGRGAKLAVLQEWCTELGIGLDEVAYIGDDLNDLDVMRVVGISACPADSSAKVKRTCDVILTRNGGDGCVREFLDHYLFGD